jgi:CheY-like chemotaxis protein
MCAADRPRRILLVDDDRQFTELLTKTLEAFGCVPAVAYTEQAAVTLIRSAPPFDLVVLDYSLSAWRDGAVEVLRALAQVHPETPVVVLTGGLPLGAMAQLNASGVLVLVAIKPAWDLLTWLPRLFRLLGLRKDASGVVAG